MPNAIPISVFITDSSAPKTGLTPLIDVWRPIAKTHVTDAKAMVELGDGWYYYVHADIKQGDVYMVDATATVSAAGERYQSGTV